MLLLNTMVSYVGARLGRLRARQDGVTAVEYALMVAIIALLMVAGFYFLFQNVSTAFDDTASCIAGPGGSTDCPTPSSRP
jgi:pilus assembly protein Flp/PilA